MARPLDDLKLALLAQYPAVLHQWFPAGKMEGQTFVLGDISGSPGRSLKVNRDGTWKDWATGESGSNLLELYRTHHNIRITAAYDALAPSFGLTRGHVPWSAPEKSREVCELSLPYEILTPSKNKLPKPQFEGITHHPYLDMSGERLLCYVYRRDYWTKDGSKRKEIRPYIYVELAGKFQWISKHLPAPRPLYNLPSLGKKPEQPVFVVSGEKCVDALQPLIPGYPVVTWPGGDQSIDKTDWAPLANRSVIYWADADASGQATIDTLGLRLRPISSTMRPIHIPESVLGQLPYETARKADVVDLIEHRLFTVRLLRTMIKEAAEWEPPGPRQSSSTPTRKSR